MRKVYLFMVFLLFMSFQMAYAQEQTITGNVTNENGDPLAGVNVTVEGTNIGTISQADGSYSIDVPASGETLVFSFVGKETKRVAIGDQTTIDVVLRSAAQNLEEVVAVGYGTKKKRDIIGSVGSVSEEAIEEVSATSVEGVLQGRTSGLQMTQAGGTPDSRSRILIRGVNSISSGTEPLIVIDGMPVAGSHTSAGGADMSTNPLSLINPSDIANIQVLKDAAATAIYGSRGSNGVILIETKSGEAGQSELNIDYRTGIENPANMYDFVETDKWLELADLARANNPSDMDPFNPQTEYTFQNEDHALTRNEIENINTDWFNEMLRQGSFNELNASMSGGTEDAQYYVSGNFRDDKGFMIGNNFKRVTARTNLDVQPLPSLKAGLRFNYTYMEKDEVPIYGGGPGGNRGISNAHWTTAVGGAVPWLPTHTENGEFFDVMAGNNIAATLYDNYYVAWSRNIRTMGKAFLDYTLPFFDKVTIHSEFSMDYLKNSSLLNGSKYLRPEDTSYGDNGESENFNYNYNVYGTYEQTFNDIHNVTWVAGAESLLQKSRRQYIEVYGTTAKDAEIGRPTGENVQRTDFAKGHETRFRSYFTRLNYNYDQRYYLELSIRRDGSTMFGTENLFGVFPAVSAGWVISDEGFMEGLGALSYLKLRGSYGLTGNANLGGDPTANYYSTWKRYGEVPVGLYLANLGSKQLTWESTNSMDIGFDYGLFDNRINGSIAYYDQTVEDMILDARIPESAGIGSISANIGDLRNYGVEFNINSVNIDAGDFQWRTSFNISFNGNEIKKLTPSIAENNSGMRLDYTNSRVGTRIGPYFLAESAGINEDTGYPMIYMVDNDKFLVDEDGNYVDQSGNEVEEENRIENPHYLETYKDSIIPATQSNVNNNKALLEDKSGIPSYYGGMTNTFKFKGFTLSATFNFQGGNYIYDNVMESRTTVNAVENYSKQVVGNYWTESNTDAKYPKPSWNNQYEVDGETKVFSHRTTEYLYKGDFIRLGTLRLGYSLPQSLLKTLNMKQVKVFVAGHNLWTYAPNYPGLDPEITSFEGEMQRNLEPGIVGNTVLPQMRQFSVGVNLSF